MIGPYLIMTQVKSLWRGCQKEDIVEALGGAFVGDVSAKSMHYDKYSQVDYGSVI